MKPSTFIKQVKLKKNEDLLLTQVNQLWYLEKGEIDVSIVKLDAKKEIAREIKIDTKPTKVFFSLAKLKKNKFTYTLKITAKKATTLDTILINKTDDVETLDEFINSYLKEDITQWTEVFASCFIEEKKTISSFIENLSVEAIKGFLPKILPEIKIKYFDKGEIEIKASNKEEKTEELQTEEPKEPEVSVENPENLGEFNFDELPEGLTEDLLKTIEEDPKAYLEELNEAISKQAEDGKPEVQVKKEDFEKTMQAMSKQMGLPELPQEELEKLFDENGNLDFSKLMQGVEQAQSLQNNLPQELPQEEVKGQENREEATLKTEEKPDLTAEKLKESQEQEPVTVDEKPPIQEALPEGLTEDLLKTIEEDPKAYLEELNEVISKQAEDGKPEVQVKKEDFEKTMQAMSKQMGLPELPQEELEKLFDENGNLDFSKLMQGVEQAQSLQNNLPQELPQEEVKGQENREEATLKTEEKPDLTAEKIKESQEQEPVTVEEKPPIQEALPEGLTEDLLKTIEEDPKAYLEELNEVISKQAEDGKPEVQVKKEDFEKTMQAMSKQMGLPELPQEELEKLFDENGNLDFSKLMQGVNPADIANQALPEQGIKPQEEGEQPKPADAEPQTSEPINIDDIDFSQFMDGMAQNAEMPNMEGLNMPGMATKNKQPAQDDVAIDDIDFSSFMNEEEPKPQEPKEKLEEKQPEPPAQAPSLPSGMPGMPPMGMPGMPAMPPGAPGGGKPDMAGLLAGMMGKNGGGGGMPPMMPGMGMPGMGMPGMPGMGMPGMQQQQQELTGLSLASDKPNPAAKPKEADIRKLLKSEKLEKDDRFTSEKQLKENEHLTLHENNKLWHVESGKVKLLIQKIDEYGKQVKSFPIPCEDIKLFFSLGIKPSADGYFYTLEAVAEEETTLLAVDADNIKTQEDKDYINKLLTQTLKDDVLAWLNNFVSLFETDVNILMKITENLSDEAIFSYNSTLLEKVSAFYDVGVDQSEGSGEAKNDFVHPFKLKANEKILLKENNRLWFVKSGEVNLFIAKTNQNDEVLDRLSIPFDKTKLFFSLGSIEEEGYNYCLEIGTTKATEFDTIYFDEVYDKPLLDNFIKTTIKNELLIWILILSKLFKADIAQTDLLCENLSLETLNEFNSRVVPQLQVYYEREKKSEKKRRKEKVLRDEEKYSESFYNLTERLISGKDREAFYDMNVERKSSNLVFKACIKVFKSKHMKIKEPKSAREDNVTNEEIVNDIATATGVQYRTVNLEGNWHLKSGGSMLAFRKSDHSPLALLQVRSSRYKMYDPKNKVTVPVTASVAKDIEKDAITFYKALPNRPLKLNDVMSFIFKTASIKDFVVVILIGLLGGLLSLVTPIMTRQIVDDVIPSADTNALVYVAGLLVLLAFTKFCFDLTEAFASMRFETMSEVELTAGMWDRIINLPVRFIKQWPAGEVMAKANGITQIRNALSSIVVNTFMSSIFSVFYFILMFKYSWQLALIGMGLIALLVIASLSLTKLQLKYSGRLIDLNNSLQGKIYGWVAGIPKIKIAGAERRVFHNWTKVYGQILKFTIKRTKITNASSVFNTVIQTVISMIIFFSMCKLTYKGLTVGQFVAFNSAFGSLMSHALSLCGTIITTNFIIPIYGRLRPFLENVPEYEDNMEDPGEITGEIAFSNVTFSYNYAEKRTIEGLSFKIKPGEYVGIVGPSGAGKSTLVKLMIGFNKPSFGEITYDGLSLDKIDKRRVRRQLGVVLQGSELMAGSIYDNIAGVNLKLTQDEAWAAAKKAGLDEDIRKMPMGLQTPITEGGSTLSGGQRQRILIARALASSPKVFIFDEATSALDNRTQDIVTESISNLGVTRIVIAHRLSTILKCDKILVLDGGRLVEEGDFQTLMNNKGLFFQMAQRQLADNID